MPPKAGPSTQRNTTKTEKEPVKDKLDAELDAHKKLEQALEQLHLQGPDFGKPDLDEKKLAIELKKAEEMLSKHEEDCKKDVDGVKNIVHYTLRDKLFKQRNEYVKERVGDEISQQVKVQVATQISNVLPVPLEDQLSDTNKYLERMKTALGNSEARLINGGINANDRSDWNRRLKEITKEDGTRSDLYPLDLASLFHYEENRMKTLMISFDLNFDYKSKLDNFNRFIQYIGVRGRVVVA